MVGAAGVEGDQQHVWRTTFAARPERKQGEQDRWYDNSKQCLTRLDDSRFQGLISNRCLPPDCSSRSREVCTDALQLLNSCNNNDHFWVFASATTSVEYDLTVTDTATGTSRVYSNDLGQPAQAITDTSAFATCP